MDTQVIVLVTIVVFVGMVVCGVAAFTSGKIQATLSNLEKAINELKDRDEDVNRAIMHISKTEGALEVYQGMINDNCEKTNKQGNYIGKLLERTRIHGSTLNQIVQALRDNQISITGENLQTQIGDGNQQSQI